MTYNEILDEVAMEKGYTHFIAVIEKYRNVGTSHRDIIKITSEAAERYRAQVELPSDEEIYHMVERHGETIPISCEIVSDEKLIDIFKWLRDRIKSQLNELK